MFHELSSEPIFAAAFAGWALLVTRATFAPSVGRFALVGLGVAVLALVRPGNAVLLAFGIVPLLLAGSRRVRFERTGAFLLAAVLPLLAWSVHNGIRFDSWGLARGGNAIVPFYRAFITDNIISPENGEQSRRLAVAMQQHLLTREPYRSYKVTLDDLFERGSFRVHEDLYLLSDQVFGWDTDYSVLRGAGVEGVRAHPGTYARGVTRTVWDELAKAQFRVASAKRTAGGSESTKPATVVIGGKRLPEPSEGEPIPAGQVVWISRPDQSIRQVWTSPTEWHFEFDHPGDRPRFEQITGEVNHLFDALPDRAGNQQLALRLNQLSRWFPRPWMWILLGLVAVAVRRPRGWPLLVALSLAAFAVVLLNALGLFADLHFVLPVAPAFLLLGLAGLLGERRSRTGPRLTPRFRRTESPSGEPSAAAPSSRDSKADRVEPLVAAESSTRSPAESRLGWSFGREPAADAPRRPPRPQRRVRCYDGLLGRFAARGRRARVVLKRVVHRPHRVLGADEEGARGRSARVLAIGCGGFEGATARYLA